MSTELIHKPHPQVGDQNLPGHPGALRCVSRVQATSLSAPPPSLMKLMLIYQMNLPYGHIKKWLRATTTILPKPAAISPDPKPAWPGVSCGEAAGVLNGALTGRSGCRAIGLSLRAKRHPHVCHDLSGRPTVPTAELSGLKISEHLPSTPGPLLSAGRSHDATALSRPHSPARSLPPPNEAGSSTGPRAASRVAPD